MFSFFHSVSEYGVKSFPEWLLFFDFADKLAAKVRLGQVREEDIFVLES